MTVIYTINAPSTVTSELQTAVLGTFQTNLRASAIANAVPGLQLVIVSSAPTITVNSPTSSPVYLTSSSTEQVAIIVECIGGFFANADNVLHFLSDKIYDERSTPKS